MSQSFFSKTSNLSLFFAILLGAVSINFFIWAMDYTHSSEPTILLLATIFGLFMAFNIGGNDVANSFGTSVGAGTLTIKQALIVAAVFEVSGAMIAGGEVTQTIRKGIVDLSSMTVQPMEFVFIMMSALLSAGIWLLFATKRGYPVSTTHSIIGGIVGSSITLGVILQGGDSAFALVKWDKIGLIALSWVISPLLGGLVAYLLYRNIKEFILNYGDRAVERLNKIREEKKALREEFKDSWERMSEAEKMQYTNALAIDAQTYTDRDFEAKHYESDYYKKMDAIEKRKDDVDATRALETYLPFVGAFGAMVISAMLIFKGLKNMHLGLSEVDNYMIIMMVGATAWMAIFIWAKSMRGKELNQSTFLMFSWLQVFTASGFAFSHGSNDIANAIGPFAAVIDVLRTGEMGSTAAVPSIAMLTFGIALIAGLWFIGKEVIQTVGHNLTKIHPASGFSAELGAAGVVLLASTFGIPVSSTHILIGAVLGIGLVNHNANWALMKPIALAWVITLPSAAILSSIVFITLRSIF
jgi:PiT family inorganic phosphate transporter